MCEHSWVFQLFLQSSVSPGQLEAALHQSQHHRRYDTHTTVYTFCVFKMGLSQYHKLYHNVYLENVFSVKLNFIFSIFIIINIIIFVFFFLVFFLCNK